MNARGGCFVNLKLDGRDATLFCFTKPDGMGTKLFIVEVGNPDKTSLLIVQADLSLKNQNDFVVSMVPSDKLHCVCTVTQHTFPNTTFFATIAQQNESITLRHVIACSKWKYELGLRGISKSTIIKYSS